MPNLEVFPATDDTTGDVIELLLDPRDVEDFAALPALGVEEDDENTPSVIVFDHSTRRYFDLSRFHSTTRDGRGVGCRCGCAAYAVDIHCSFSAFLAKEEAEGR